MRLIDADALLEDIRRKKKSGYPKNKNLSLYAASCVLHAPTVEPAKRGKWIANTDDFTPAYRCSCCGYNRPMIAGESISQWLMNYCSNCGAKMDLE